MEKGVFVSTLNGMEASSRRNSINNRAARNSGGIRNRSDNIKIETPTIESSQHMT
jgi:hypothetical protein